MAKHPAIFLDRDGTLIEDNGYISNISDVNFFPYTFKALQLLQKHFLLFIITNQSGISKGLTPENNVQQIHVHIANTLKAKGITIFDTFCCPHKNEDRCNCKKPKPYFIDMATQLYNVDLNRSFIIGDHPSDVKCGKNAGITPVYILSGHGADHKSELKEHTIICKNLLAASKYIISTI